MQWRLILEEFNPKLTYIKGENNEVADALSRLDVHDKPITLQESAECFVLDEDDLPFDGFPLLYKH